MKKQVYCFGESPKSDKYLLGGKGANLNEMTRLGLPVPPGFTITTEVCDHYYRNGKKYPAGLWKEVEANMKKLEKAMGKAFGNKDDPLLVSVRSGAASSMPGMMDTVLNLGLTPESVRGLAKKTKNPRFAWDAYRRFINMFGDVVMNVPHEEFEHAIQGKKDEVGAKLDTDLSAEDLEDLCGRYLALYEKKVGKPFLENPMEQLKASINAVFGSWMAPRAIKYR